ncbi:MAG TPA: hypothetical protein VHG30_05395 [Microvirga sp.]|nr:hypothetical protein [Microvirga sp.]
MAARYGRIGLIIAAFALVAAIIVQPLRQRPWPVTITVAERGSHLAE